MNIYLDFGFILKKIVELRDDQGNLTLIDFLKSLFFPGPFDYDLRPLFLISVIMVSSIAYAIRKDWPDIKDEYDSDWEQQ